MAPYQLNHIHNKTSSYCQCHLNPLLMFICISFGRHQNGASSTPRIKRSCTSWTSATATEMNILNPVCLGVEIFITFLLCCLPLDAISRLGFHSHYAEILFKLFDNILNIHDFIQIEGSIPR